MTRVVFWLSGLLIAYTYVLFPVLVVIRGVLRPRPVRTAPVEPSVTVVITARNEEATIEAKIENVLKLDYPVDRLEVVVLSDGSTDRTVELARSAATRATGIRVRVLDQPATGKARALTAAVPHTRGDILVFSDANSMYAPTALRALVAPFADEAVGGVAGNQVYTHPEDAGQEAGELGYWGYDRILKEFESRAGNAIGGTGAIYAIRRSLFRPIPIGVNDDFFLTAGVVHQGARLVFAADAVAWEAPATDVEAEYGRKVRVVSRAMRCVATMPGLLDPRRTGFYAVQLFSHKVLRWVMGLPLLSLYASSGALQPRHRVYRAAFLAQTAAYAVAALGLVARGSRIAAARPVSVAAYFVMVNAAGLRALWNLVTDHRVDQWQPVRALEREPDQAA